MADHHADLIDKSYYAQAGIMRGVEQHAVSRRGGRWCHGCNRLWNTWNHICRLCGNPTTKEVS